MYGVQCMHDYVFWIKIQYKTKYRWSDQAYGIDSVRGQYLPPFFLLEKQLCIQSYKGLFFNVIELNIHPIIFGTMQVVFWNFV